MIYTSSNSFSNITFNLPLPLAPCPYSGCFFPTCLKTKGKGYHQLWLIYKSLTIYPQASKLLLLGLLSDLPILMILWFFQCWVKFQRSKITCPISHTLIFSHLTLFWHVAVYYFLNQWVLVSDFLTLNALQCTFLSPWSWEQRQQNKSTQWHKTARGQKSRFQKNAPGCRGIHIHSRAYICHTSVSLIHLSSGSPFVSSCWHQVYLLLVFSKADF